MQRRVFAMNLDLTFCTESLAFGVVAQTVGRIELNPIDKISVRVWCRQGYDDVCSLSIMSFVVVGSSEGADQ